MFGTVHIMGEVVTMDRSDFFSLLKAEDDLSNEINTVLNQQTTIQTLEGQIREKDSQYRNLMADLDGCDTERNRIKAQLTMAEKRRATDMIAMANEVSQIRNYILSKHEELDSAQAAALTLYRVDTELGIEYYAQSYNVTNGYAREKMRMLWDDYTTFRIEF